jgi:two-component system cell cycle sensor histidine kinase/response regulator CckA
MRTPLRVLFIEDCQDDAALQVRLFEQAGYEVAFERVDSPLALNQMLARSWDLIISDYSMPQYTGTDALRLIRKLGMDTPFIFVSGTMGEDSAVAALKMGAQDYLMKTNLSRLIPAVQRELREAQERKHSRYLEQQVHQLQRFEAIGRLAGGVAHDFNNVIGAIMGWAEMGFSEAPLESLWRDRFLKIRMQAARAAALTRQLLAFARRQILLPTNTDLNELVREALTLLKNVIGERIVVEMNLAETLPPVFADPSQLEQVIMNLCLNARDALGEGGRLTITTGTIELGEDAQSTHPDARSGRYILLGVSDTGEGIATDDLEYIFEPFFTTKDIGKGTGLGLATVHGVVKQHKGFILVDSARNCGTTFRIYLPASNGAVEPLRPAQASVDRGTENILIAEDDDDVRETTQQMLQGLGYTVFAARDGAEAISLFRKMCGSIDLVLLDVIMPVLNGPDSAIQISAIKPETPFIFATGYANESNLGDRSSLSNCAILQKPYDTVQLASKVREILDASPRCRSSVTKRM